MKDWTAPSCTEDGSNPQQHSVVSPVMRVQQEQPEKEDWRLLKTSWSQTTGGK